MTEAEAIHIHADVTLCAFLAQNGYQKLAQTFARLEDSEGFYYA